MVWNKKLKRDIPISWETKQIDDVAEIYNGATPSTINELNYGGDIVWITPKDLSDQKQKFVYKEHSFVTFKYNIDVKPCTNRFIGNLKNRIVYKPGV